MCVRVRVDALQFRSAIESRPARVRTRWQTFGLRFNLQIIKENMLGCCLLDMYIICGALPFDVRACWPGQQRWAATPMRSGDCDQRPVMLMSTVYMHRSETQIQSTECERAHTGLR